MYIAGSVKSTVDYIFVQLGDKAKSHNVNVIQNEECVPEHKLLVTGMHFNTTKDGIRSSSRECMYGSSRRKRHEEAWSEIR